MVCDEDRHAKLQLHLSPRQEECLRGVLQLKSAKEIARDLGISPHAVEKHLRLCREKIGVASSAEAARQFARADRGSENPHSEHSDLVYVGRTADEGAVLQLPSNSSRRLEDINGAASPDRPFSPRQTLLTIAAVSFLSIVGLLLLVACAEAVRTLVTS